MDPIKDKDLLWIAKEGLKAPLPDNWKPCQGYKNKEIFYHNFQTNENTYTHPCDEYYKNLFLKEKSKHKGGISNSSNRPSKKKSKKLAPKSLSKGKKKLSSKVGKF